MKCSLDFKKEIKEEVLDYLDIAASPFDKTYTIDPKIVTKKDIKYINDYYKDEVVTKINDTTISIEPSLDLLVEKQEIHQKALAMINKAPEGKREYQSISKEPFIDTSIAQIIDEDCQ